MPILSLRKTNGLQLCCMVYACSTLVSMATMSVGALLLMLYLVYLNFSQPKWWLLQKIQEEWHQPRSRLYLQLSLLLFGACILSLMVATGDPVSYGGHQAKAQWLKSLPKVWYLFWPWLLVIALRKLTTNERRTVFLTWIFAFGALSVLGIFQHFTGWPRWQPIPGHEGRFHATLFLGHHLSVASIFIFPFFATLDYAASLHSQGLWKKSWPFWLMSLLGSITLFLTYSRTLWAALPVGVLLWIYGHRILLQPLSHPIRFGISSSCRPAWTRFLICLSPMLIGAVLALQIPQIRQRLYDPIGIQPRMQLWAAQWEFFKARPLTGVGWRTNAELSGYYLQEKLHANHVFSGHAHNNFLDCLGGMGALGTLATLLWCVGIFLILFKNLRMSGRDFDFSRSLLCAWVVFHINGLTQVNLWEGKVEHQIAWVIAWSLL